MFTVALQLEQEYKIMKQIILYLSSNSFLLTCRARSVPHGIQVSPKAILGSLDTNSCLEKFATIFTKPVIFLAVESKTIMANHDPVCR